MEMVYLSPKKGWSPTLIVRIHRYYRDTLLCVTSLGDLVMIVVNYELTMR
jgi:hypothetical protein